MRSNIWEGIHEQLQLSTYLYLNFKDLVVTPTPKTRRFWFWSQTDSKIFCFVTLKQKCAILF